MIPNVIAIKFSEKKLWKCNTKTEKIPSNNKKTKTVILPHSHAIKYKGAPMCKSNIRVVHVTHHHNPQNESNNYMAIIYLKLMSCKGFLCVIDEQF